MKIYCFLCKRHVLDTSEKFVMGGPYKGEMFSLLNPKAWQVKQFRAGATKGNLVCPHCEGPFSRRGALLTEHGTIKPGQQTVDTSLSIIHHEGIMKGRLKHIIDSKELPAVDRVAEASAKRQAEIDAMYGDVIEQVWPECETLACPSCGKEYKNTEAGRPWYQKHVAGCKNE